MTNLHQWPVWKGINSSKAKSILPSGVPFGSSVVLTEKITLHAAFDGHHERTRWTPLWGPSINDPVSEQEAELPNSCVDLA